MNKNDLNRIEIKLKGECPATTFKHDRLICVDPDKFTFRIEGDVTIAELEYVLGILKDAEKWRDDLTAEARDLVMTLGYTDTTVNNDKVIER
jgi:hypothetical protein